ncbi:L-seryl-tRNA(Sec) selenium transferase [Senegalimassilia faecalis]|uniref:L-seryl-tRNA(Sec) selenium transferase n=1 Tax=Senegalimassilia faecalis TaxID=2509433 RepID=UPI003A974A4D
MPEPRTDLLRALPQVEELMQAPPLKALENIIPRAMLVDCARGAIDSVRQGVLAGTVEAVDGEAILEAACHSALATLRPSLRRVINATGVVIHTNLGRSVLAESAVQAVVEAARGYSTLEYSTQHMARGSRHDHVEHLICTLTGAEAAIAVNNNAAAVMMVLAEFAAGHEAIVSRGELVEIGGSFRVPDIMAQSNARMVEVGATNKTHAFDYERAITPDTAMLLKVHPSNYRMIGFTESVSKADLRRIADAENARRRAAGSCAPDVLVYEDQGSGAFLHLDVFGEYAEPTVRESLSGGCDLVSFSGDKLLGGPQAGIIVGKKAYIDRLKKHPLARAMRLDKMTLAALEATLRLYLDPQAALQQIPTLRMLTEDAGVVHERAEALMHALRKHVSARQAHLDIVEETGRAGGGSLPMCDIDTYCVRMEFKAGNAQACEVHLQRNREVPVIGRIKHECVLFDARTITESDIPEIAEAVGSYFATLPGAKEA